MKTRIRDLREDRDLTQNEVSKLFKHITSCIFLL